MNLLLTKVFYFIIPVPPLLSCGTSQQINSQHFSRLHSKINRQFAYNTIQKESPVWDKVQTSVVPRVTVRYKWSCCILQAFCLPKPKVWQKDQNFRLSTSNTVVTNSRWPDGHLSHTEMEIHTYSPLEDCKQGDIHYCFVILQYIEMNLLFY